MPKHNIKSPNKRPTIGFLNANAAGIPFFHLAWRGVADVAGEHDVNAIGFVGEYVRDPTGFKAQANIRYDLMIDTEQLDGLVIQNLMCNMLDPDEVQQFYDRYRPLPIVSLGRLRRSMEGIPSVLSSGYAGMRQAIVHLIEVPGRRRIAYISGRDDRRPGDRLERDRDPARPANRAADGDGRDRTVDDPGVGPGVVQE